MILMILQLRLRSRKRTPAKPCVRPSFHPPHVHQVELGTELGTGTDFQLDVSQVLSRVVGEGSAVMVIEPARLRTRR